MSAGPQMNESSAPLHVIFRGSTASPILVLFLIIDSAFSHALAQG